MPTKLDTRVTPALHPDNVQSIDGYGEDTAAFLAPTVTAFDEAYQGVSAVHVARDKAKTNPTWNEAQQVIHTDDLARKVFAKIAKGFDTALGNLKRSIAHIESELSSPLESKAAHPVASEIRAHMKNLPTEKRHSFIKEALDAGDVVTVSSVLGAPAYLSGLDAQLQQTYTRMWREKASPELSKRLKAMNGAKNLIIERSGLIHRELEKAVGSPPPKVAALRAAKTAAEQAFALDATYAGSPR